MHIYTYAFAQTCYPWAEILDLKGGWLYICGKSFLGGGLYDLCQPSNAINYQIYIKIPFVHCWFYPKFAGFFLPKPEDLLLKKTYYFI